jgi:hypothetical protein
MTELPLDIQKVVSSDDSPCQQCLSESTEVSMFPVCRHEQARGHMSVFTTKVLSLQNAQKLLDEKHVDAECVFLKNSRLFTASADRRDNPFSIPSNCPRLRQGTPEDLSRSSQRVVALNPSSASDRLLHVESPISSARSATVLSCSC